MRFQPEPSEAIDQYLSSSPVAKSPSSNHSRHHHVISKQHHGRRVRHDVRLLRQHRHQGPREPRTGRPGHRQPGFGYRPRPASVTYDAVTEAIEACGFTAGPCGSAGGASGGKCSAGGKCKLRHIVETFSPERSFGVLIRPSHSQANHNSILLEIFPPPDNYCPTGTCGDNCQCGDTCRCADCPGTCGKAADGASCPAKAKGTCTCGEVCSCGPNCTCTGCPGNKSFEDQAGRCSAGGKCKYACE